MAVFMPVIRDPARDAIRLPRQYNRSQDQQWNIFLKGGVMRNTESYLRTRTMSIFLASTALLAIATATATTSVAAPPANRPRRCADRQGAAHLLDGPQLSLWFRRRSR